MRTVVTFEALEDRVIVKLTQAVGEVEGLGRNAFVDVSPLPVGNAQVRGDVLRQRLIAHPPVQAGVQLALSVPRGGQSAPLYFHMIAALADELPWEQLYVAPYGFCTLDGRWPVARIAEQHRPVADRAFLPPLRVVAVLSAAGRSGMAQVEGLLAATDSAHGKALGIHLHIITGQEDVRTRVLDTHRPDVTAELIAGDGPALVRQIGAAHPQVLHLLCHGGMTAGVPTLAFATIGESDDDTVGSGSLRLGLSHIMQSLEGVNPWLVVLNACDTAEVANGQALAHALASAGIPAVIGMRRLVDINDADRFCASLYPEVLATIHEAVDPTGSAGVRTIDWACALTTPRMVLSGADPSAVDVWSDPVLYVQEDEFRAYAPSERMSATEYADLRGELDVWEGYLNQVRDPDEDVKAKVQAHIRQLRERLEGAGR